MSLLVKAVLEISRIIALLMIFSFVMGSLYSKVLDVLELTPPLFVDAAANLFFLSLFYIWYRRKGQYKGWFPIK